MRLLAGALTGIATAAAVLVPTAAQAAAPYTAFTINGAANSYVLGYGSRVLDSSTSTMTVNSYPGGTLIADVQPQSWSFHATPPTGADFVVGTRYETVQTADETHASLYVGGEGRGCGGRTGWLVFRELVRNPDTQAAVSFAASYGYQCDNALEPHTGEIRYNSSIGYAAATVSPDSLDYGNVEISPNGPQKTATVTAAGTQPTTFEPARIAGADPRDFTVVSDGCRGKTLMPGQTCSVTVRTNPTQRDERRASLVLPTTNGGGPSIGLHVQGFIGAVGTYYPRTPARLMDTRNGTGVRKGTIGQRGVVSLQVMGRGGVPGAGVSAVVLNVTVTSPSYASYLTVYPTGQARPNASNLNYPKGWTGANAVTVPIGAGGKVDFYNHSGSTHVIADVVGFYAGSSSVMSSLGVGDELIRSVPERILDTRTDGDGKLPGGWMITLPIDYGAHWNQFIGAVAVNITAVGPGGHGYLTAWDGGDYLPPTSTLNFSPGATVPNMAVVPTGYCHEEWCSGYPIIGIYNGSSAATHILVDIVGFYEYSRDDIGLRFTPMKPTRIVDSRSGLGIPAAVGDNATATVTTPSTVARPETAALAMNVTAVSPTAHTYVTVWPAGVPGLGKPGISHLNVLRGQTVPNAVISGIGPADAFHVYNNRGSTHILVDVAGTFNVPWGAASAAGASARAGAAPEPPRLAPEQPSSKRSAV